MRTSYLGIVAGVRHGGSFFHRLHREYLGPCQGHRWKTTGKYGSYNLFGQWLCGSSGVYDHLSSFLHGGDWGLLLLEKQRRVRERKLAVHIAAKLGEADNLKALDRFAEDLMPYDRTRYAKTAGGEIMRVSRIIHAWAAKLDIDAAAENEP